MEEKEARATEQLFAICLVCMLMVFRKIRACVTRFRVNSMTISMLIYGMESCEGVSTEAITAALARKS